ncbi:uncharacterized protein NECHADRAFT_42088 [Fusarium vanettenii 77-13-4]|uniref:Alpha-ketoglutarate-dependent sulfonate dioxygenase n=1 Tax=Fusarium vanettenii (strain ATCC MYA-4622 / CBS 123669 / FGSC 9596 / NRRL 45880 / 77-13-4) TaxID=660122 RepID=C7ZGN1_FUSV7|nr:uncharacterized protein NECHADRAFT_42088 [Fusarium vanettenii 77-13-4]EEU36855.1 hypothetical protein NECHADRAFT_42088 [Fusarium vanettenii 77-13-4]
MSGDTQYSPFSPVGDKTEGELSSTLSNLQIQIAIQDPNAITCLAHLKLIHAFAKLKESIGYTDGLFGLWDSRARYNRFKASPRSLKQGPGFNIISDHSKSLALSKLREKRWAIYVARAVDRYEAWWSSMFQLSLKTSQLSEALSPAHEAFPVTGGVLDWNNMVLPPLDVLMVLHTHMLNPRLFLEDCMRYGAREFWAAGMPWEKINAAIDKNFNYIQSEERKSIWSAMCARNWDNTQDTMHKLMDCPSCRASIPVPWTTCGMNEGPVDNDRDGLVGTGYADGNFSFDCTTCGLNINHDVLSIDRFLKDCAHLLETDTPMRGTILDIETGRPQKAQPEEDDTPNPRVLANDALKDGLGKQLLQLSGSSSSPLELYKKSSIGCRIILLKYHSNASPFALALEGAVLRQCIFIDDMTRLDWIHQASNTSIMENLLIKYNRFFDIMKENPESLAVPTLDIDLAWHTHLLSPFAYYRYSNQLTEKLIDHADKIDEVRICKGFKWTNEMYQSKYGEVYTECSCWYCEIDEKFHQSGLFEACPADRSPHLSSHNSVKIQAPTEKDWRWQQYERARDNRTHRLHKGYDKLCRRAKKNGRPVPPRKTSRNHWGHVDDSMFSNHHLSVN